MGKHDKLCAAPACLKRPSFAPAGSKPACCSAHSKEGMVDVRNKKCAHPGCTINPTFGTEGTFTRIFCATHREQGMISLTDRRRREATPRPDKKPRANLSHSGISEQSKSSADGRGRRGHEDGLSTNLADGPAQHDSADERWRDRDPSFSNKQPSADRSTEPKKKRARRPEDTQLARPLATAAAEDDQAKPTAAVDAGRWVSTGEPLGISPMGHVTAGRCGSPPQGTKVQVDLPVMPRVKDGCKAVLRCLYNSRKWPSLTRWEHQDLLQLQQQQQQMMLLHGTKLGVGSLVPIGTPGRQR